MIKNTIPTIDTVDVPKKFLNIYDDVSLNVQLRKARNYNLTPEFAKKCIEQLQKRPYYLVSLAKMFNAKNILEVGTAQGLQFFSFAEYARDVGGHVWSCDIQDVRNKKYSLAYADCTTFCLGDSEKLAKQIDQKIDMFYIDGAHDYGSVIRDVANLRDLQSDNPIWIFDDFDERFGCYEDIKRLTSKYSSMKYRVGNTTSGNPSHQAIIFEKI